MGKGADGFNCCIKESDIISYKAGEDFFRRPGRLIKGPEGGPLLSKFRVRIILLIIGGAAMGLSASSPSFADIYKFIDEDGVVHFTNVPTHGKFKLILKEKRVEFRLGPNFEKYDATIMKAAEKHGVDYALVKAVIKAESNFNPTAISRVGARGLMQLMPGTAYALRVNDSFHPEDNIDGGVRYLRYLLDLYQGNVYLALAAYNAGEKAVYRYRGVPPYPETKTYVKRVLRYHEQYINESKKPNQSADNTN